jgi:predicted  nucleic acid-binding Zn-ribbon protein
LAGCKCGAKFFYYIRQDRLDELNRINSDEIQETLTELDRADKTQIEKDIREITGLAEEPDKPVILDLESVRVLSPGKFEIDIVNLFSKKRPVIYRLEEGKYIIDLTSTYKINSEELHKKIRNPEVKMDERVKEKKKGDKKEEEVEEREEENEDDNDEGVDSEKDDSNEEVDEGDVDEEEK